MTTRRSAWRKLTACYYFEEYDECNPSTGGLQIISLLKSAFLPCIHNQTTLHADRSHDGREAVTSSVSGLMRTVFCASLPPALVLSRTRRARRRVSLLFLLSTIDKYARGYPFEHQAHPSNAG